GLVPYATLATFPTAVRILATLFLLIPMGVLMGTFFPRGMAYVLENEPARGPWYWAMNGACSVVGSVLAMMISMECGLERTLWAGLLLYVVAQGIQIRLRQQTPGVQ